MIAIFDVHYDHAYQQGALVFFRDWSAETAAGHAVSRLPPAPAAYQPGEFWRRELPMLRWVLESPQDPQDIRSPRPLVKDAITLLVIDGFVDLGPDKPGFGRKAYETFGLPVVGIAKTYFNGAQPVQVTRGKSKRPLYVTAAGLLADEAAVHVASMHGKDRLPTMVKLVDKLSRS